MLLGIQLLNQDRQDKWLNKFMMTVFLRFVMLGLMKQKNKQWGEWVKEWLN
jgi:hypothetical protein